jgi:hypothetical protein
VPDHLGPAIVKADCIRFKAGPRIFAKFINYVLNAPDVRRHAKAIVHGVGRPRLNLGEIKSLPIPVPPIPEQHRIVAEIEKQFTRLDAGVAALKRVQANLKRYRAAVLKAACEGKLVPTEAEIRRTADYADIADKKLRPSASSAVKTPPFETGEQLLQAESFRLAVESKSRSTPEIIRSAIAQVKSATMAGEWPMIQVPYDKN